MSILFPGKNCDRNVSFIQFIVPLFEFTIRAAQFDVYKTYNTITIQVFSPATFGSDDLLGTLAVFFSG